MDTLTSDRPSTCNGPGAPISSLPQAACLLQPLEGQRTAAKGQRKAVDGPGEAVEGQRKAVEGQGEAVEGQRKAVEGQGEAVEDCTADPRPVTVAETVLGKGRALRL